MQQSAKTANDSALIGQNMENAARTGHIWSKNAGEVARNAVSKKKKTSTEERKICSCSGSYPMLNVF